MGKLAIGFGVAGAVVEKACGAAIEYGFPLGIAFAEKGVEPELTVESAKALPSMPTNNNAIFYGFESDKIEICRLQLERFLMKD